MNQHSGTQQDQFDFENNDLELNSSKTVDPHISSGSTKNLNLDRKLIQEDLNLKIKKRTQKEIDINYFENSIPNWTENNLFNLKYLFRSIFCYDSIDQEMIYNLSTNEKEILKMILMKRYQLSNDEIKKILKGSLTGLNLLKNLQKNLRKEENLKYGFRMILRYLYQEFEKNVFSKIPTHLKNLNESMNIHFWFYAFHFSETEFGINFQDLIFLINKKVVLIEDLWPKLQKYVFPEIGIQWGQSTAKSLSKSYLYTISQNKQFSNQIIDILKDMIKFISFSRDQDWDEFNVDNFSQTDKRGISILKTVSLTNKKELEKLYKEWDNLIYSKFLNSEKEIIKNIKKNIIKFNFKFPWSYVDLKGALVETLITFSSIIKGKDYMNQSNLLISSPLLLQMRTIPMHP